MKIHAILIGLVLISVALTEKTKADENSAYDENPNAVDISELSPEDQKPYAKNVEQSLEFMTVIALASFLITKFESDRKQKALEKYQQEASDDFWIRYKAGLTKWNTTSQKTRDQAGGLN